LLVILTSFLAFHTNRLPCDMPGCSVSLTTKSFCSVVNRRRRATPVMTSTFENVSDIGVCLAPRANAGVRSKRGAVQLARWRSFALDGAPTGSARAVLHRGWADRQGRSPVGQSRIAAVKLREILSQLTILLELGFDRCNLFWRKLSALTCGPDLRTFEATRPL
jgi:hypothetical protein